MTAKENLMKITPFSLIFAMAACVAIGLTLYKVKRDELGFRSALVWIFLWACIVLLSFFPGLLNSLTRLAQVPNRVIFILIVAVFILFALIFNLSSRLDKSQRNIAKLVQEIAILKYKQNTKNKIEE